MAPSLAPLVIQDAEKDGDCQFDEGAPDGYAEKEVNLPLKLSKRPRVVSKDQSFLFLVDSKDEAPHE